MTPRSRGWLWRACVWGQVGHFDALGVELMGFWVARGIAQFQNNFKRQSLTGKEVPNLGTKYGWNQSWKSILAVQAFLYNQKTGNWCLLFPFKAQGLVVLQIRAVLIINLTEFPQNGRGSLSLSVLNPRGCFSSLLTNACCGTFSQYRVLQFALKTCLGGYSFSSMTFLMTSQNSSPASWLAEAASPVILIFFKSQISF